jgi:hypothetical protein
MWSFVTSKKEIASWSAIVDGFGESLSVQKDVPKVCPNERGP